MSNGYHDMSNRKYTTTHVFGNKNHHTNAYIYITRIDSKYFTCVVLDINVVLEK